MKAHTNNDEAIIIRGARAHNLKNISLEIPRDRFCVITGPSGSGKSSLAFDTIYAEGQRRYVESLSVYARQFLDQLSKPDVDVLEGLSPTISIEQRTTSYNPRSTVGTVTEIYDYLRLLFARISKAHCWKCGDLIRSQSPQQIIDSIFELPDGSRISVLAPIVRGRKGEYQKELAALRQKGFVRVRIDGEIRELTEEITLQKTKKHDIDVYVDRLILKKTQGDHGQLVARISDSCDLALKLAEGQVIIDFSRGADQPSQEKYFSTHLACGRCDLSYPLPEPRTFSFNSPVGACPACEGIGTEAEPSKEENEEAALSGEIPTFRRDANPCPVCLGQRLRRESLSFRLANKNIAEITNEPISDLISFFQNLELSEREKRITDRMLKEIRDRLLFLEEVGVGYLSLSRSAQSLSGGEAQRIRLATQIGSALVGVIYVLDEPSIGLHQRDNDRLLESLQRLRDMGNTVLVVEHDKDTMLKADWIVDLGPGAGTEGGHLVGVGTVKDLLKNKKSVTGRYLSGDLEIAVPKTRRPIQKNKTLKLRGARENNLKDLQLELPLGHLICVTGISGSGKSTLVLDTLYPALIHKIYGTDVGPIQLDEITGTEHLDKVIDIDQSPIGKTPRSNPATYTGLFTLIRDLFAQLPESQIRGYKPGRFSFNVKGGRCDSCEGDGLKKIEMHFLSDVYVECEICQGRRYNQETLGVLYKGKNIAEVLAMTGTEALPFFDSIPAIKNKLTVLNEVGLGYLQLGQSSTTLSGGESQRIKLARELSKRSTGRTFYLLDEPSTGLHFDDVAKLIKILQTLVDQGNTVVVIEHNLDIIKCADTVVDLGPEGGSRGGEMIGIGTPEQIAAISRSFTGKYLRPYLPRTIVQDFE